MSVGAGPEGLRHRRRGLGRSLRPGPVLFLHLRPKPVHVYYFRSNADVAGLHDMCRCVDNLRGKAVSALEGVAMEATSLPQLHPTARQAAQDLDAPFRPQPNSAEETGISFGQLLDLTARRFTTAGGLQPATSPRPWRCLLTWSIKGSVSSSASSSSRSWDLAVSASKSISTR